MSTWSLGTRHSAPRVYRQEVTGWTSCLNWFFFFHNHEQAHTHAHACKHTHTPLPLTNPLSHRKGEHSTHIVRRGYRVMQLTLTGLQHINKRPYSFAFNIQASTYTEQFFWGESDYCVSTVWLTPNRMATNIEESQTTTATKKSSQHYNSGQQYAALEKKKIKLNL